MEKAKLLTCFDRSQIRWLTKLHASYGSFRLDSLLRIVDPNDGTHQEYGLGMMVMAGNMYLTDDLLR